MSEQTWLDDAVQGIVDRLKTEGAEGVIVAVHHDDAEKGYVVVQTSGMLCLMDGMLLGKAIFDTMGEGNAARESLPEATLATPEVTQ